jgi:hypothetical protein
MLEKPLQKNCQESLVYRMDILRVPSVATNAVIPGLSSSTEYDYVIVDDVDHSTITGTATSNSSGVLSVTLPSEYDGVYTVTVDNQDHYFNVVRPYVDPTTKASTASEIKEYSGHEELARSIIDSVIAEGFYYRKRFIETVGLGSDYIPVWQRAQKVLKLYENNVLLYDAMNPEDYPTSYALTSDKTAITEQSNERTNRLEGAQIVVPWGASDLFDAKYFYRGFPKTFDYRILISHGYVTVPSDIRKAAELLVDDIACGKLEYYQRYISGYNTDQFKIQVSQRAFSGTGNLIVDKILSNYARSYGTPGVL